MLISFIIISVSAFFLIGLASRQRTVPVKIAYAGSADDSPTVKKVAAPRNNTIFTSNGERVNLSGYDCFLISGNSLERQGLTSGTFVYTTKPTDVISEVRGKFVIFRYDVARQAVEHPDMVVCADSFKARKGVTTIATGLDRKHFEEAMSPIIQNDSEIADKTAALNSLWEKYSFASDFYKDKERLIVSLTYRQGRDKTYSFHSPKFLVGIVRYISVD